MDILQWKPVQGAEGTHCFVDVAESLVGLQSISQCACREIHQHNLAAKCLKESSCLRHVLDALERQKVGQLNAFITTVFDQSLLPSLMQSCLTSPRDFAICGGHP